MEEQEEGREYKNKKRKKNDINTHTKMIPQTMISLRKLCRTVQAVGSKIRVACYFYSIDGVSPPSLLTHMYLLHFHLQYEKQYPKHLEIDVYLYLSIYTFLPSLWALGTKEKKLEGENLTPDCPKNTEAGRQCGERKKKTKEDQIKEWRYSASKGAHRRPSVVVPVPSPFLVYPSCWLPEVLSEDPALFPPLYPVPLTLNKIQLDTGTRFL